MGKYEEFRALKADVVKTNDCIGRLLEKFDWDFFSDSGAVEAQGYEVLADAFQYAYTMKEAASELANELHKLKHKIQTLREAYKSSDDELTVAKWLIKWIGENFEAEIVEEYPELLPSYLRNL